MAVVLECGYRAYNPDEWCLRVPGAARTLCGEPVSVRQIRGHFYEPDHALRPTNPATCCPVCSAAASGSGGSSE